MFAAINAFLTRAVSGYFLNKSLRFRSSASAYLNRTPAVAGSRTTWTWSGWVKRGTLGSSNVIISLQSSSGVSQSYLTFIVSFTAADVLQVIATDVLGGSDLQLVTTQVFRDPAAWYHITVALDTTQATASNRVKIYANGAQITAFGTAIYPVQNYQPFWNNNQALYTGYWPGGPNYFDGEMAEVNFVDGQALAPTAFGAYSTYNQWLPKKYAGTYGTNGFYLPFTNTASTSTLVADSSGNANNWTPNNISLTAGSTYDSLTDVPTLTSTTVANYAVLNPLETLYRAAVISNGNLNYNYPSTGGTNSAPAISTIAISSGTKIYFELVSTTATYALSPGIRAVGTIATSNVYLGYAATEYTVLPLSGNKYSNNVSTAYGTGFTAGDVIGCAVDLVNGKIYWSKNGSWFNSGDPAAGTNPAFTGLSGNYFACVGTEAGGNTCTGSVNFGQQPFAYTPPSGFLPLNTFNIAAGTVTTSGTFTGNLSTDGPMVYLNGTPTAMTINGNAVTFGTHADKLANGFKVRSSSVLYNLIGSNTYVATTVAEVLKYENAQPNP